MADRAHIVFNSGDSNPSRKEERPDGNGEL